MIRCSTIKLEGPKTSTGNHSRCVGCARLITEPGLQRTGGVLDSPLVRTVLSTGITAQGNLYEIARTIRITRYVKGILCDKCAGCYWGLTIGGTFHPLVKIDPLHGLPKPRDSREGGRKWKVLNTRFTQ